MSLSWNDSQVTMKLPFSSIATCEFLAVCVS